MPDEKILVIDDDKEMNDLICTYIVKEGFTALQAFDGKDALQTLKYTPPDMMVLDIMLPDIDGTNLCLEMRKSSNVPILFLSSKREEIDKIVALSVGGDDYMTKPFPAGEFVARIKAHLRRHQSLNILPDYAKQEIYAVPGLTVNLTTCEVVAHGKTVSLTHKELEVLSLLIRNPKRVFSSEQLYELAWRPYYMDGDAKTAVVCVSTLRKKIEISPRNPEYIMTIRGFGYKFNQYPSS